MNENENETVIPRSTVIKKGIIAVFCAVLAFAAGEGTAFLLMHTEISADMFIFLARSIFALIPFLLLGGKKWLRFGDGDKAIGKTFKFTLPLLICNIVFALLLAAAAVYSGIQGGAAGRILLSVPLALLIGINEELIFRGLLFEGILALIGRKKKALLTAAVIASVVFGFVHVAGELDFSNAFNLVTALLKTIECTMFAVILCYCCTFYHNIIGAILFHALFDWVVVVPSLLINSELTTEYTGSDQIGGIGRIIMYGILIAVYLPKTIRSIKSLKAAELTDGIFGNGDAVTDPLK